MSKQTKKEGRCLVECCTCQGGCSHEGPHFYCVDHAVVLISDCEKYTIKPFTYPHRITFQGDDGKNRIVVDLDLGRIELDGDWDEMARLFIERCEAMLGMRGL